MPPFLRPCSNCFSIYSLALSKLTLPVVSASIKSSSSSAFLWPINFKNFIFSYLLLYFSIPFNIFLVLALTVVFFFYFSFSLERERECILSCSYSLPVSIVMTEVDSANLIVSPGLILISLLDSIGDPFR